MAIASGDILREVRRFMKHPRGSAPADRELLERFSEHRDEAAFCELVRRHETLVMGVCQRILGQTQDAEDAFQATFLLLAKKAQTIRSVESVASWLYGVAQRVAAKAKVAAARRRRRESRAAISDISVIRDHVTWKELKEILDRELGRLPEKYRAPLLLCYLEGKTQDEAACLLGWTASTVHGRVNRGRDLLRRRLIRGGFSLSAGLFASMLSQPSASAATAMLRKATVKAVLHCMAGKTGTISTQVLSLAHEGLPMIVAAKARLSIAALLALTVLAAGAGLFAHQPASSKDDNKEPAGQSAYSGKQIPEEQQPTRLDRFGDPLPTEALARLGTVRFRHGSHVGGLAYSPDGKQLATYCQDHAIYIWDADTGKELRRCLGHTDGPLMSLVFAPDGKTLASGGYDKTMRIWDAVTGKEIHRVDCNGVVCSLAFSPDGNMLAAGVEKTIELWSTATYQEPRRLQGSKDGYVSVAFSPDSKYVASGGDGESACLWEAATGKEVRRFGNKEDQITGVVFSPDGKGLLAGCLGAIRWWDVATGDEVKQFNGDKNNMHIWSRSIAFSRDGKTLFASLGGRDDRSIAIRAWDVATAKELRVISNHRDGVASVTLSPNGKVLAACGDYVVRFWDVETGKEICQGDGHAWSVVAVGFAADGKTAVSVARDGAIRKWDAATGESLAQVDTHAIGPKNIFISDSPHVSATLSADAGTVALSHAGTVWLWNIVDAKELAPSNMVGQMWGRAAFSPSGRMLAAPTNEEGVYLYDLQTGKDLPKLTGFPSGASSLAFRPDGGVLAVGDGTNIHNQHEVHKLIHLFDVAAGKEIYRIQGLGRTLGLAFTPDGRTLAAWHADGDKCVLMLWEVSTGRERARLTELRKDDHFLSLAFSPDGRNLASTGSDNSVGLWDVVTGKGRHLEGHRGPVISLAFSGDGKRLLSGSDDTSVLIWDLAHVLKEKPVVSAAPSSKDLDAHWTDLGNCDATQAYKSMAKLTAAPKETLSFLKEHLHPAQKPDLKGVPGLLADLDSEEFAVRKKAVEELEKLGDAVEPALRKALGGQQLSLETRQQLERLLEKLAELPPERLQVLRALEVVERLDTAESRQLLEKLAAGPADDFLTKEAKAITKRLATKDKK